MTTGAEIAIRLLREAGTEFDDGLTEFELQRIERIHQFRFDVDHRGLLSIAMPLADGWFDWRARSYEQIEASLAWPIEGVLWDVENNAFWPTSWGRRPDKEAPRQRVARRKLRSVPKLVPLHGNRFMAAIPGVGSAPVFSVMQADVIFYGDNLPSHIARELGLLKEFRTGIQHHIPFWSSLAKGDPKFLDWPEGTPRNYQNRGMPGSAAPLRAKGLVGIHEEPSTWQVYEVPDGMDAEEMLRRVRKRPEDPDDPVLDDD